MSSIILILNRKLGETVRPVAFNLASIVVICPAFRVDNVGNVIEEDGSHILTVSDHGGNGAPWKVVETFEQIVARLPSDMQFGLAAKGASV
jgi:hypothetical protein